MQTPETKKTAGQTEQPKKQVSMSVFAGALLVVALGAFIIGTRSPGVFAMFGGGQNKELPGQLDLSSVQDVYGQLKSSFDGKLDTQKLVEGAKKGLTDAAGDPYTVYFTDEEAKQFQDDLEGKFSGIGAELEKKGDNLFIRATLDDSPARKAGLQDGDIIVKVNDQETTKWSVEKAVSEIRGDKGTTVKLSIVQAQQLKEVSIVRDNIINPSVKTEITSDGIGVLRVSRFADDTSSLARQAAADFKQKGVKGVILDLRGDGGGYLSAAQDLSSLWLKPGKVIVEERGQENKKLLATGSPLLEGIPTVVLIDGGSASASEIVAGALHDHGAAKLVGEKTFGKGSVQTIQDVKSGGQLKVTIAKWFTPNGINISKEGIKPDVEITVSRDDIAAGNDVQRAKALDLLKK
ncbi:MAG TPA: S41 family peptidase [Candidatus Saccharimonadales bacterium]|nr:S41 family peptidase [Candidatus Saccharimonadales bacterium]